MAKTVESLPTLSTDAEDLIGTAGGRSGSFLVAAGIIVTAVGIGLRFYCPSALWLDETISVNISRLPISQIPMALSHDGAPPLYYVMLHYWMLVFGQGDVSVRALSGVISVISLPFFWYAGNRLGGRRTAWIAYFLAVTSPFAIYYATCTRMYALMILASLLLFLALIRALEQPTAKRLVALGLATAVVLYTHYWGLYLIVVTGAWLLYQVWRHQRGLPCRTNRPAVLRCFGAMVLGSLLFIPWAPVFVFQTLHTGTPWTGAAGPDDLLNVFSDFSGVGPWAHLLTFLYFAFIVLGIFGRRVILDAVGPGRSGSGSGRTDLDGIEDPDLAHGTRVGVRTAMDRAVGFAGFGPGGAGTPHGDGKSRGITLVLQPNRRALPVFGVLLGSAVLAVAAGAAAQAAFVARYAAAFLPLFILLVALGVSLLWQSRTAIGVVMSVTCAAGLLTGYGNNAAQRTQAVAVAQILNADARPGDLVLYCPDQLGPAVNRLVTVPGLEQLTFPRAIGPQRIDWVDYKATISHTNVENFAEDMVAGVAPGHTIWLVWRNGYPGFGQDCGDLDSWLTLLQGQGTTVMHLNASTYYEYENLTEFHIS